MPLCRKNLPGSFKYDYPSGRLYLLTVLSSDICNIGSVVPELKEANYLCIKIQDLMAMVEVEENKQESIREKVEEMGIFFERSGFAPVTGRVLAFLLMCEPPYKDFFAIQAFLKASKSTVSNALSLLSNEGLVEYITFSGDRRRYFRINTVGWLSNLKSKVRRATLLGDLLKDVLDERCESNCPAFNNELKKIVFFQSYLAKGIEQLIEDWEVNQTHA